MEPDTRCLRTTGDVALYDHGVEVKRQTRSRSRHERLPMRVDVGLERPNMVVPSVGVADGRGEPVPSRPRRHRSSRRGIDRIGRDLCFGTLTGQMQNGVHTDAILPGVGCPGMCSSWTFPSLSIWYRRSRQFARVGSDTRVERNPSGDRTLERTRTNADPCILATRSHPGVTRCPIALARLDRREARGVLAVPARWRSH